MIGGYPAKLDIKLYEFIKMKYLRGKNDVTHLKAG
jgi:hypothetical protein